MIRKEAMKGCYCRHGINAGVPYNCKQPCNEGEVFVEFFCDCWKSEPVCENPVGIQVESWITTQGPEGVVGGGQVTSWLFVQIPPGAFGRVSARGKAIEVFFDGQWRQVGLAPFVEGQEWEGEVITDVIHYVTVSPNCV